MSDTIEIRWHGRGGQGTKTAALLLADVVASTGRYVQGFPEYGPERMGAPITAYNRVSDSRIRVHSNIYTPKYVVVVDETLLQTIDVAKGLDKEGAIIVNTAKAKEEVRKHLNGYTGRIHTIDARQISEKALGQYFPNVPMLAAIIKIAKLMDKEKFIKEMKISFEHKFVSKPEVVAGNMKSLELSLQEVQ